MRKVLVGLMFASLPALAADVQVWGRSFTSSCSYYTSTWGDYDLTFRETALPWGSKVTAVVAFGGYRAVGGGNNQYFSWDRNREMPMSPVAPFTWRVRKSETLASRSSNLFFTHLKFIFKVEAPGKAAYYVNGGSSWGHFQVEAVQHPTPCVDNGSLPDMKPLPVQAVEHR